jgi:hypothetical protein
MSLSDYLNVGQGSNSDRREANALSWFERREGVNYAHYARMPILRRIPSSRNETRWLVNGQGLLIPEFNLSLGPRDTITVSNRHRSMTAYEKGGRIWDVNLHSCAHMGLLPDFLQDVFNVATAYDQNNARLFAKLMYSAEDYLIVWERCEQRATWLRRH